MSTAATSQLAAFDVATIKAQFPLLRRTIDGARSTTSTRPTRRRSRPR